MKKLISALLALMLIMLIPAAALAQGDNELIPNADFSQWLNGTPEGWAFYSPTGTLSQNSEDKPHISLDESDFALLTRQITLKAETCYRITCPVSGDVKDDEGIGANINIEYQGAYSTLTDGVLSICVRTNVADTQDYMLRIGIGDEYSPARGTLDLGEMSIEELSVIPEDVPVYTLVGEIGIYGYSEESPAKSEEQVEEEDLPSYNDIGLLLCCLVAILAMYLLVTGVNGKRLGNILGSRSTVCAMFIFAFLLRLFVAVKSGGGLETDLSCFRGWASMTQEYGLSGFYESGIFADYPPAYMYVLWVIASLARLVGLSYQSAAFLLLLKLPAIICDMLIGYLIYRFGIKKLGRGASTLTSLFMLLSPMVIIVSCSWAQIDSVFTLALLGVLLFMYRKKTVAASGVWMLALMIKPQALLIAPIIAIVIINEIAHKETRKRILIDLALCIPVMLAVYTVISLPMKGGQGFFYVFTRMLETTGQYDYASVNAFNLFALARGNFIDASTGFLFTSYKAMGWIMIALSTALCAYLYIKKNDRKYIFITSAIYLTCIFMFAHSMHERYIYPAVILFIFAAVLHDSRRLLSAAAALSAGAFVNIFAVLSFDGVGTTFLPYVVVLIGSILFLAAFAWAAVCCARFYKNEPDKPLSYDFTEVPPLSQRHIDAAKIRLGESPDKKRRITKKDMLIMLAITAVYSIAAFTNLGSLNIPEPATVLNKSGDSVIIELPEETQIDKIQYYAGYCEGNFEVSCALSDDTDFFDIGETVEHEYSDMFRWQSVDIGCSAKYIKLTLTSGEMEFREIGLKNTDGFIRPVDSKYILSDGSEKDASEVIDEFDELPHNGTSYMTEMYFDEVYHARTAYEYIHGIYPYEITHPPLGKAFIALGCMIFGFNPFGWRCMGALAGVLMLPVMYIFVKRIFKNTKWAAFATALFSVEFMHFVQTRIATIDSFSVLFIMLMYMCMYEYSQHNLLKEKLSKTLLPLGMSGLFFALGAATKWICLYAAPGLCILFFYTVFCRAKERRLLRQEGNIDAYPGYAKKLTLTIIFCIGVFLILPAAVYILSYYPYYNAMHGDYGLIDVWKNQTYMLSYHGNLSGDPHPYQSSVYTWPFVIRPVYFFLGDDLPANMRSIIWCLGHPLIYIGGTFCCVGLIGRRGEAKRGFKGLPFILVALAWQLMPWVIITREVFHYHFFASVPFLIILITYFMRYLCDRYGKKGRIIAIVFLAASAALFILFYPALSGVPMSVWWARLIKWSPLWPVSV